MNEKRSPKRKKRSVKSRLIMVNPNHVTTSLTDYLQMLSLIDKDEKITELWRQSGNPVFTATVSKEIDEEVTGTDKKEKA